MRRLIREGVKDRVLNVDELLKLSDPGLAFNDPTDLATKAVSKSRSRMNDYWQGEQKRFRDDVAKTTRDILRRGLDEDQAVRLLMERTNVSRSRATLICQDQMLTSFAEADRQRQLDLGVTEYLWRTRGDNRARRQHTALNGKRRAWSDRVLYPGSEIRCRCRTFRWTRQGQVAVDFRRVPTGSRLGPER
ncbi:minor capsid protein [Deinococcus yavapaiensis]|uniref:SPP1 gp7 family putative phage head morphogenesis protein n=1 Tax=Deinococcus yavapaiensis KR-236 TaxID=694435 RepID=A0A318S160_9DEIO|nr:minor capsid protein [Deinococcus yavapaiensis]PYE51055.1 SPP1 gp7 family putative phage head morphogenesis protein [Deinococcus yavapaiensis KR-236]